MEGEQQEAGQTAIDTCLRVLYVRRHDGLAQRGLHERRERVVDRLGHGRAPHLLAPVLRVPARPDLLLRAAAAAAAAAAAGVQRRHAHAVVARALPRAVLGHRAPEQPAVPGAEQRDLCHGIAEHCATVRYPMS